MVKLVPGRFYIVSGSKDENSVGDVLDKEVIYPDMFYIRDERINNQRWHVFFGKDDKGFPVRARIKTNESRTGYHYASSDGSVVTVALTEDRSRRSPSLNEFFDLGYGLILQRLRSKDPRIREIGEDLWQEVIPSAQILHVTCPFSASA